MKSTASDPPMDAPRLDDQLCFSLYGALQAMTRAYKPRLERMGLTYPQYLVMLVLWEGGEPTVKALGDRLGLDSGTLTPLLKRMEKRGLLTRRRDLDDERLVRLALTAEGAALAGPAAAVMAEIGGATGLALPDLAALRDQLKRLKRTLDEA